MTSVIRQKSPSVRAKKIAFTSTKYFFLVLFSIFFVFPIYALVINSFMPDIQFQGGKSLWPTTFYFGAYLEIFTAAYVKYFFNTILVCVLNVGGVCFGSALTAYALAKLDFFGKNVLFACIMGIVLLPSTVLSIPLLIIYKNWFNWGGTLYPLWVPMWLGGGTMNIFLVRQFMRGIPNSYNEAASLDGATSFQIFWMIVLPLVKPILIYLAVTGFIGNWNDFQGPLMYVADAENNWTLSLALYYEYGINSGAADKNLPNSQMAVGVMMMIPCIVLFGFFQKQIMEGISAVGVKG
ncbi:MAG: carbohydrate ABC transporter permease [Clostridia bacterium]|nr:carbohydrate ABC transporter permease [Clostridia bacterium]MBQ4099474.1 carbohydrate ABC transporter permease [Clostridia bacterium]